MWMHRWPDPLAMTVFALFFSSTDIYIYINTYSATYCTHTFPLLHDYTTWNLQTYTIDELCLGKTTSWPSEFRTINKRTNRIRIRNYVAYTGTLARIHKRTTRDSVCSKYGEKRATAHNTIYSVHMLDTHRDTNDWRPWQYIEHLNDNSGDVVVIQPANYFVAFKITKIKIPNLAIALP